MRTSRKKPDTAEFNAALSARIEEGLRIARAKYRDVVNESTRLEAQAACDHDWKDHWEDDGDHHRSDMTQVWVCQKCRVRT